MNNLYSISHTGSCSLNLIQFLIGVDRLGTGAMELHAMHLKSIGAITARTLSYSACEFEMLDGVSDEKVTAVYNNATELWTDLHSKLADRCQLLMEQASKNKKIRNLEERAEMDGKDVVLSEDLRYHQDLHMDSDSEGEDSSSSDDSTSSSLGGGVGG